MPEAIPTPEAGPAAPSRNVSQEARSAEAKTQETQQETIRKQRLERRTVLSDCRLMLRYALDESCRIPLQLGHDIAKVDAFLIAAEMEPLSEVPLNAIKAVAASENERLAAMLPKQEVENDSAPETINDIVLGVHNTLSDLVAPATAQSLRATDPDIVWFGLPPLAKFAIIGAIVCTGFFVYSVPKPQLPPSNPSVSKAKATPSPSKSTPTTSPENQ